MPDGKRPSSREGCDANREVEVVRGMGYVGASAAVTSPTVGASASDDVVERFPNGLPHCEHTGTACSTFEPHCWHRVISNSSPNRHRILRRLEVARRFIEPSSSLTRIKPRWNFVLIDSKGKAACRLEPWGTTGEQVFDPET